MTKPQLESKLASLEEELHISNNSVDYWEHEAEMYRSKFEGLKSLTQHNKLFQLAENCSLSQLLEIEEFIKKFN